MDSSVYNTDKKKTSKAKSVEFMEKNDIKYNLIDCCECNKSFADVNGEGNSVKNRCCNFGIIVQATNKDVYRIFPCEILYIAIEHRKSVLYLTDKKVETNYRLNYWKDILDPETFVQPHSSFIVNLNYVYEVTKEWVKVKYGDEKHLVYTSSRKNGAFKKAFLNFGKR